MGDSIACGVAATPQAHGWLILPADLPLIQASTLLAVAKTLQDHVVVVPSYQGHNGHPVGFQAACGPALMQLSGDTGARAVVAAHSVFPLALDDEGIVLDVDTVPLLAQAETQMRKR
jgi:molybdenum cofactor cytidylyltransferase